MGMCVYLIIDNMNQKNKPLTLIGPQYNVDISFYTSVDRCAVSKQAHLIRDYHSL